MQREITLRHSACGWRRCVLLLVWLFIKVSTATYMNGEVH